VYPRPRQHEPRNFGRDQWGPVRGESSRLPAQFHDRRGAALNETMTGKHRLTDQLIQGAPQGGGGLRGILIGDPGLLQ
jgi:hypothetical protein